MVIDYAVMLILVNKEEERLTNQPNLHYVVVSGKNLGNRIPSFCRTVAASYLEKHPEYRLAFSESWEYLGRTVTIDMEKGEE